MITAYLVFARLSDPEDSRQLDGLTSQALAALGWGTTAGVLALALTTLVPLARLGLRLRPRLRFAAGDQAVIIRIAAAGLAGLVLQQLALLLIGFLSQRSGDQGALTRFTWSYALYLLPYAVLAAPLLQTIFPRLAAAAESGPEAVRGTLTETGPVVVAAAWLGAGLLAATAVPVARVFVLGPGSGRTAALAWPIVAFAPAVVGFSLLGLATRTLLAQHRARAAGLATASGWLVVIVAVLVAWSLVPPAWLVAGIAGSISAGMIVGGILGWLLVRRGAAGRGGAGLTRPMLGSCRGGGAGRRRLCRGGSAAGGREPADGDRGRAGAGRRRDGDIRRCPPADRARAAGPDLAATAGARSGRGGVAMRIALVLTASTGGIGRHVASIAPRLVARGHAVQVFCPAVTAAAQDFTPGLGGASADRPGRRTRG